jgi:AraC-like DNA-binding protein
MIEQSGAGGTVAVTMRFQQPAPILTDLITAYYIVEVAGPAEASVSDILHPEWGNLRFRLNSRWDAMDDRGQPVSPKECALFGPTSRARRVVARVGAILGVGFTPLGWALLIARPAQALADRIVDAVEVFGADLTALHAALRDAMNDNQRYTLLDAFFSPRVHRQPARETLVHSLHRSLLDPAIKTVDAFAAAVGISHAALARACLRDFGFTPKILLSRQRFLRTLAALSTDEERPIGEVIDSAYVDHSHFNRDFRRFMGMTPSAYLAQPRLMLRAATGERDRALGAALQGLHQLRRASVRSATRLPPRAGADAARDRSGSDSAL